jgi:hypothetical protein
LPRENRNGVNLPPALAAYWEKPVDWHNEIAADWPAPRDDEPKSLRQDIVDELADHLRCAMNREIHITTDAKQAKKNVLDRFGHPAKIARKLWLDEMWEKIMLQRATLAVTAILAAAGVAACVMLGMVLEQNRTVNAAILQSLQNVSAPAAELKSLEWNPVKVRDVSGKPGGPPMQGIRVSLWGDIVGTVKDGAGSSVVMTTDKNGLADFGLVRPGYFRLTTTSPWSETMTQKLTVRPGTTEPYEIVCPAASRKEADVTVSVDWPDELKDKTLWLVADFSLDARQVNQEYWSRPLTGASMVATSENLGTGYSGGHSLFLSPDGKQTLLPTDHMRHQIDNPFQLERQRLVLSSGQSVELKGLLSWPEGTVKLLSLVIGQSTMVKGGGVTQERLPFSNRVGFGFEYRGLAAGLLNGRSRIEDIEGSRPATTPIPAPTFRVVTGKPNRWTISLPDELVKKVKARLAPFDESGSEPDTTQAAPDAGSQN